MAETTMTIEVVVGDVSLFSDYGFDPEQFKEDIRLAATIQARKLLIQGMNEVFKESSPGTTKNLFPESLISSLSELDVANKDALIEMERYRKLQLRKRRSEKDSEAGIRPKTRRGKRGGRRNRR